MDINYFQKLNDDTIDLVDSLRLKKKKIICIESCTGGLLSSSITSIPNTSNVFEMGLVTYSNDSKVSLCGFQKEIILNHGAVSKEISKLMSEKVLKLSNYQVSDLISISSTGISGPKGGSKKKPIGTIYISISHDNETKTYHNIIRGGNRKIIQVKSVIFMIEKLSETLKKL